MSLFNRKGYRSIKVRDTKTGQLMNYPVKIGKDLDLKQKSSIKKAEKQRLAENREYKKKLREFKKKFPQAERSSINWAEKLKESVDV